MTKYNFHHLKIDQSAFYRVSEDGEAVFRNAVASWVKRRRQYGDLIIIKCRKLVRMDIAGNAVFLGMEITREE